MNRIRRYALIVMIFAAGLSAQTAQPQGGQQQQPEFIRKGQQLMREGKLEEALALYRETLQTSPDSVPANNAAGVVLDLMGKGVEARKYFAKSLEAAQTPRAKANAARTMAMSYAFDADSKNTAKYKLHVFDYFVTTTDFYHHRQI